MQRGPVRRVVITGASGFVGRQIVPHLERRGFDLLLVGRNAELLRRCYPGFRTCTYDQMTTEATGHDVLVHLATLNNDTQAADGMFQSINVDFLLSIDRLASSIGIPRFINLTSTHVLKPDLTDSYSRTKREGDQRLRSISKNEIISIYAPAIYGDEFAGKLKFLSKISPSIRKFALDVLSALRPVLSATRLARAIASTIEQTSIAGHRRIFVSGGQHKNCFFWAPKRLVDIVFAFAVLIGAGWLMLIIAVAVKLTSKGPAIFSQLRVGQHQKPFVCYKFRTMNLGTIQAGTHDVAASSMTSIGGFLRRTKLDELPQIFNILLNQMSLVGPRPCLPMQIGLIQERKKREVFQVLPGITGLAQINNIDMSDPIRLAEIDAEYVALRTLPMEFRIVISTFLGKGRSDKIKY